MPTFPSHNSFGALTYTGGGAASADGQSAVLPPGASAVTNFLDCGGTPILLRWESTGALTVQARSSASLPPLCTGLIQPRTSDWTWQYDPSLSQLPAAAGWTTNGTATTEVITDSYLHMASDSLRFYTKTLTIPASNTLHVLRVRVKRPSAHYGTATLDLNTAFGKVALVFRGSAYGANAGTFTINGTQVFGTVIPENTPWDIILMMRTDGTKLLLLELFHGNADGKSLYELGHVSQGNATPSTTTGGSLVFGNNSSPNPNDFYWGPVQYHGGMEWAMLSSGDNPSLTPASARRYVQVQLTNGTGSDVTLTDLDLASDLTVPDVLANVLAVANANDLFVRGDALSGVQGRAFRLLGTGDTVLSEWELPAQGFAFCGLADGQYAASVAPITDDGVTGTFTRSPATGFLAVPPVIPTDIYSPTGTLYCPMPTVMSGRSTTLVPVFSGGTASVDNGVGSVVSGIPVTVTPTATTTYTLTVINGEDTHTATQTVTVTEAPVQPGTSGIPRCIPRATPPNGVTPLLNGVYGLNPSFYPLKTTIVTTLGDWIPDDAPPDFNAGILTTVPLRWPNPPSGGGGDPPGGDF